jgi:hypothetical protein
VQACATADRAAQRELEAAAERLNIAHLRPVALPLFLETRSTIAMAFSPDGQYYASTHGDHTVRGC